MGMPFTGWWDRYGVAHPSYHPPSGGAGQPDWAVDIYQGAGTQVRPRMSGPNLALKVALVRATCGSAGQTVVLDVHTNGEWVGSTTYGHLANVAVSAGQWISPDTVIGQLSQWSYQSGCWEVSSSGGIHTHVTGYNRQSYSCYHDPGSGSYLGDGHAIGIVGGAYATAARSRCNGTAANPPFGSYDEALTPEAGRVRVRGWAIDDDARTSPVTIHAYVGGQAGSPGAEGYNLGAANAYRPDVGAAFPGAGNNHGFDSTITTSKTGNVQVCTYAIDIGGTDNKLLGCKTVAVADPMPFGHLDATAGGQGTVSVRGWAIDRNAGTAPISIHVYVGGEAGTPGAEAFALTAGAPRADVGAAHPWAGANHGFDLALKTSKRGPQKVCAYAINVGPGENRALGCKDTAVANGVLSTTKSPGISGKLRPRRTVMADPGQWSEPGVTFTYRWLVGGDLKGVGANLKIRKAWIGKRVVLEVTAARSGFDAATANSRARKVRR